MATQLQKQAKSVDIYLVETQLHPVKSPVAAEHVERYRSGFSRFAKSNEVASLIMLRKKHMKEMFSAEYNAISDEFEMPKTNWKSRSKENLKYLLTGQRSTYIPPNSIRVSNYITETMHFSIDNATDIITIRVKTSKPTFALKLIEAVIRDTNKYIISLILGNFENSIQLKKKQIDEYLSIVHRTFLSKKLQVEELQYYLLSDFNDSILYAPLFEKTGKIIKISKNKFFDILKAGLVGLFIGITIFRFYRKIHLNLYI